MTEADSFQPSRVSPPGETIEDLLEEKGWTATEFAERMAYTPKHVNELLHGRASITADTALRLESVLGSTAQFWLNRESQYRETLARKEAHASLVDEGEWLRSLPLKEMFGWGVPKLADGASQIAACLKFFGVSSVAAWHQTYSKPVEGLAAFRASTAHAMKLGPIVAWLRQGEILGTKQETLPWNRAALRAALPDARKLTRERDPEKVLTALTKLCGDCGVALVRLHAPEGCPVSGATKFLSPEKALMILSVRYLRDDSFWFSFFHEAAHLILHPKRTMFLEMPKLKGTEEDEANTYAQNLIVPPQRQAELTDLKTAPEIEAFAKDIGVSASLVLGQLRHRKLIRYGLHDHLIVHYKWAD